jgi:hypothetical protein
MGITFSLIVILFSAIIHEYMHGWMTKITNYELRIKNLCQ